MGNIGPYKRNGPSGFAIVVYLILIVLSIPALVYVLSALAGPK